MAQNPFRGLNGTKGIYNKTFATSNPDLKVIVTFNTSKVAPGVAFWSGFEALTARAACFVVGWGLLLCIRWAFGFLWNDIRARLGRAGGSGRSLVEDCFKVISLLVLKVGLFPLFLGCAIERCSRSFLAYTLDERYMFMVEHPILGTMILWIAGITFMLVVTILALQMREILHPDILHHLIRPHDPSVNFLHQLLSEPMAHHAKKIAVSSCVYLLLVLFFVRIPALAMATVGGSTKPRLHYALLELQLPMELILFHMGVLYAMDHGKDIVYRLQTFYWDKASNFFGVREELMPLVVDDVVSDAREESDNDETNDVDSGDDGDSISDDDDDDDDDDDEDDDQGRDPGVEFVPDVPQQANRPARALFANAFAVPVNSLNAHELYPRKSISVASSVRILGLLVVTWLVYFAACCIPFTIPLLLGRILMAIEFQIPFVNDHDPHAFLLGWLAASPHIWKAAREKLSAVLAFARSMSKKQQGTAFVACALSALLPVSAAFALLINVGLPWSFDDEAGSTSAVCSSCIWRSISQPGGSILHASVTLTYIFLTIFSRIEVGRAPAFLLQYVYPSREAIVLRKDFGPLIDNILLPAHKAFGSAGIVPATLFLGFDAMFPSWGICNRGLNVLTATFCFCGAAWHFSGYVLFYARLMFAVLHLHLYHQRYLIGQQLQNAGEQ